HGITLLLYRNSGQRLAGPRMPLPAEVDARMPKGGPQPPPFGEPPSLSRRERVAREAPPGEGGSGERRGRPPRDGERRGPPPEPRGEFFRDDRRPGPSQSRDIGPPFLAVASTSPQYWVGVRMPIIEGPNRESLRSVLMFVSPSFFTNPFFFDIRPWIGVAAAVLIISALCWLPLVRNLTHSIADMMRATAHIAEGRFDVSLQNRRRDELGRLGGSIN